MALLPSGIFFDMNQDTADDTSGQIKLGGEKKRLFMKRHILIISKDDSIGRTVKANTMNDFTEVSYGRTSIQALEMIVQETYSLLIFDILIHDMDGRSFLQIIRKLSYAPILVLTKKLKIQDRIKLLNMGADDCLVWPADADELIVRMEACMKRSIERLDIKPDELYSDSQGLHREVQVRRRDSEIVALRTETR